MSDLFKLKETKYSFRNETALVSSNKKTPINGMNSITHLASKIWDLVPEEIRNSKSLNILNKK